jgi:hypothetical protein
VESCKTIQKFFVTEAGLYFDLSYSCNCTCKLVCLSLLPWSNICGQGKEPTLRVESFKATKILYYRQGSIFFTRTIHAIASVS